MKKSSALEKLTRRAAPVVNDEVKAVFIPLSKIRFDPSQPRKAFHHPDGQVAETSKLTLEELAQSIEANGLIHPITVESIGDGTYRVVVGERRTRAYLLLGRTVIEAKVRDDLTNPKKRLIYQVAENVNREDLSDADMASSIRTLMEGTDDVEPMTQTQIAKELGKSEGWVSRYVKYGDEEQQRLWVVTGIADTVEKLYRLSILPVAIQAEIQRRVQLPEDDPEYLAKPLLRSVIDGFSQRAKAAKMASATPTAPAAMPSATGAAAQKLPSSDTPPASSTDAEPRLSLVNSTKASDGIADDPVSRTLADLAVQGRASSENATAEPQMPGSTVASKGEYTLPAEHRANILSQANVTPDTSSKASAQPPVSVRAPMASLQALLDKLDPKDQEALLALQLSISLPGPLAERIANALTGAVVDTSEVPAVVQNELVKLQ